MRPTSALLLVGLGLLAFIVGRLARPLSLRFDLAFDVARVGWMPGLTLILVTAVLFGVSAATRQTLRQGRYLPAHQAVNRLVLAKSCALVAAGLAGYYLGIGLGWVAGEPRWGRAGPAGFASLMALGMLGGALALEKACRVPDQPPDGDSVV